MFGMPISLPAMEPLIVNNEPFEMVELFDKLEMSVPPYRFVFEDSSYEEEIQHHDSTKTQVIADTSEDYEGTEVVSSDAANKDYFTEVNQGKSCRKKTPKIQIGSVPKDRRKIFSDEEYDGTEVADKMTRVLLKHHQMDQNFHPMLKGPNFQSIHLLTPLLRHSQILAKLVMIPIFKAIWMTPMLELENLSFM